MKFRHGEPDRPTVMEHLDEIYREDLEELEQQKEDIEVMVLTEREARAVDELLNEMRDPMYEATVREHEEMMKEEMEYQMMQDYYESDPAE